MQNNQAEAKILTNYYTSKVCPENSQACTKSSIYNFDITVKLSHEAAALLSTAITTLISTVTIIGIYSGYSISSKAMAGIFISNVIVDISKNYNPFKNYSIASYVGSGIAEVAEALIAEDQPILFAILRGTLKEAYMPYSFVSQVIFNSVTSMALSAYAKHLAEHNLEALYPETFLETNPVAFTILQYSAKNVYENIGSPLFNYLIENVVGNNIEFYEKENTLISDNGNAGPDHHHHDTL